MSEEHTTDEHGNVIFKFIDFDDNSLPSIDTPREDIPQEILMKNTVILTQEVYEYLARRAGLDAEIARGIIEGNGDEPRNIVRSFQATIADAITDGTPLPKGHWIKIHPLQADDPGAYMCSCCEVGDWNLKGTEKFCPNCGAEMTEGEEE